jgi:hypothetical protein
MVTTPRVRQDLEGTRRRKEKGYRERKFGYRRYRKLAATQNTLRSFFLVSPLRASEML